MAQITDPYLSDYTGAEIDESVGKTKSLASTISAATAPLATKTEVQTAVATEKNRAQGAENTLTTAIATEKTRAEGVETAINTQVTSLALKVSEDLGGTYEDTTTSTPKATYEGISFRADTLIIYGTGEDGTTSFYKVNEGDKVVVSIPKTYNNFRSSIFSCNKDGDVFPEKSKISTLSLSDKTLISAGNDSALSYTINSVLGYNYIAVSYKTENGAPNITITSQKTREGNVVKSTSQSLTSTQKNIARNNIGAASKDVVDGALSNIETIGCSVKDICDVVFGETESKTEETESSKTYSGFSYRGDTMVIYPSARMSLAFFKVHSGAKVNVTIPNADNGFFCNIASIQKSDDIFPETAKISTLPAPISLLSSKSGRVTFEIESVSGYNYIGISYNTSGGEPTVTQQYVEQGEASVLKSIQQTFTNEQKGIIWSNIGLKNQGTLYGKNVRFFGSSLTSGSGFDCFAKLIAENYGAIYEAFIYDSQDGHSGGQYDVEKNYARFVNYAKDGTSIAKRPSRTDNYIDRVKRHITSTNNIDVVLMQFSTNDFSYISSGEISLGSIVKSNPSGEYVSADYTAEFDTSTTIGSLEEICRYLTVEVPTKFGVYVPWATPTPDPTKYNPLVEVLEKWGVPYIDLRSGVGFNLRCSASHRNLYTKAADSNPLWSETTTYNLDDMVRYNDRIYKCKNDGVVGILPTDTTNWTDMGNETHDGVHLNNLGHKIVANKIQQFMESL